MNHSDKDVTQGYIILSIDKLRLPMQQITDTIKGMMAEKKVGKVIQMRGKKKAAVNQ